MNESLLKIDRIGRLRYTSEQKKTMVDACRASGLSTPRFAALHGVNYQTLVYWIKKDQQSATSPALGRLPAGLFSLVPAVIEGVGDPASEAMQLCLPGGAKLSISSSNHVALAAALIRELQPARPC